MRLVFVTDFGVVPASPELAAMLSAISPRWPQFLRNRKLRGRSSADKRVICELLWLESRAKFLARNAFEKTGRCDVVLS